MRVAVLGAYGAVGSRLVATAAAQGHEVTAAGRDPDRLSRIRAHHHVTLAAGDADELRRVAESEDVVVNATGVEDPALVLTTTAAGAAFMDISAEGAYLERLARLPHASRPVVAGVGLAPGLTNLLAAGVTGTGPLHIGIVGGVGERHGDAGRRWVWQTAGKVVTSGGTRQRVYRAARRFHLPRMGHRTLLRAAFGEQDQLAADLARPVSTWLGLDPPWATSLLALAGLAPRVGAYLDRLSGPMTARLGRYQRWQVVVADETGTLAWASGIEEVHATAAVAALSLEPLRRAEPGVYAAHRLLTLAEVRDGLREAGIVIATRAGGGLSAPSVTRE
ncbi:NAD(P)H-binding protein [Georgenia sp. H159]|uniref:NAD(P)H-binding protein n=1 Tax=Georgenia sp. H159 TaxID=3076115 RepID=UPI002D77B63A|nr:NAD(P)H-binding protein [Georgenia sp. H159]